MFRARRLTGGGILRRRSVTVIAAGAGEREIAAALLTADGKVVLSLHAVVEVVLL